MSDGAEWWTSETNSRWAPLPTSQWPARIKLCRQRGAALGYEQPGQPLSDYEPCESCGTRVVAIETPSGDRGMAELAVVRGDPDRLSSRLNFDGRWHTPERCRGRR